MFPGSQTPRRPAFSPTNRSILLCCIGIAFFIAILALAPTRNPVKPVISSTGTQPVTLNDSQIASFRELYQKISTLDTEIQKLDAELISIETMEYLSNPENVTKYYQQLTKLQVMRGDRALYAQNYNGLARIHFTKLKTSPIELTTAKGGFLPMGIR